MKTTLLIGCIALLSLGKLQSQNNKTSPEEDFKRAEKIFSAIYSDNKVESASQSKRGYAEALPIFLNLYKKDTANKNLAFKIGVCYQATRRYRIQATPYFNKAVTSTTKEYNGSTYEEKQAPFVAYKFLGDAYHLEYKFDKAMEAYEKFIALSENNVSDKAMVAEAKHSIEMCKTGKVLVATPLNIKLQNLGNTVNSSSGDYSPVLSADQNTLFFTSRRPQTTGSQKDSDGNFMEDIYMSTKTKTGWSPAKNIGTPINTEWHEATVGLSPDGQTILIYRDDSGDGNIYSTSLDGDVWSTPVKLNDNINSKHWEPSAFISANGLKLYFVSDKPGGYGGRDLYVSKREVDGDWEKATNMGASINTQYDEDAPFIHPDGVTLSFSSNGHNTMGGFDIFSSFLSSEETWSEPVNVGFPINTTDDDIFYVISPDGKTAYFSSFREGGMGEKDNFLATFPDIKEKPLTLVKGTIIDESGKPAKYAVITVTDNETEKVVGVYKANSKTGAFLFILTPGKNYNITYQSQGHLFYSENIEIPKESNYHEINKAVTLNPITVGSKIVLNNIFFDFDKATLRPLSNVEIKNLVTIMRANPTMKVEISGHTDSKGNDEYNKKLSEERAQAVVNKLIESGISANRFKAKGYGETKHVAPNTNADGSDNPEGRQLNRRVELTITEIN
ncbi:MAG: PD40 domain-containing protein [Bacteroidia bacterium]|nr:PD40 domain-containing protein [Bacteroidia bacterium]